MAKQEITVPDIGDYKNVDVIEVFVKPGDSVQKEGSLISLETDKATMEVPSPVAGKVVDVKLKVGDKVSQGSLILVLEAEEGVAVAAPSSEQPKAAAPTQPKAPEISPSKTERVVRSVAPEYADGMDPKSAIYASPQFVKACELVRTSWAESSRRPPCLTARSDRRRSAPPSRRSKCRSGSPSTSTTGKV
jgi:pyruvate/2-oxoglutarate dehydrogenase complex dihydrolipoamide acyltransferase (E2) component